MPAQLTGPRGVLHALAERSEADQRVVQEPPEPDALSPPAAAHAVHSVVPVAASEERQPMRPGGPPTLDRGEAMPVERGRLRGGSEALIALRVARSERIALQKIDLLVEQRLVTGRGDVVRGRE